MAQRLRLKVHETPRTGFALLCVTLLSVPGGYAHEGTDTSVARTALREMVNTELEFARTALEEGTKKAFLQFLADDGIVFQPGPVNGKSVWQDRPVSKSKLVWHPSWADVSFDGTLGCTTGPWRLIDMSPGVHDTLCGHFFTVWRRQADGSWKVGLDVGISHPAPQREAAVFDPFTSNISRVARSPLRVGTGALDTLERSFAIAVRKRGIAQAYGDIAGDSIRVYRAGKFPTVGMNPLQGRSFAGLHVIDWKPLKSEVAVSGDLGYSYGSFVVRGNESPRKGWFVRIWRNSEGREWKLVVDFWIPGED